jgi:signal transduction histidine kinase
MGVLALSYIALGRAGLSLDAVSSFATLVWAPTGIALAALVYFGRGVWPGVAVGAFILNLWNGAPPLVAGGIAFGNTLEAVVGAALFEWAVQPTIPLRRLRQVIAFVVVSVIFATTISATVGVASLLLGGLVAIPEMARTWTAWWMGDAIGALVVAPVLLAWVPAVAVGPRRRWWELAAVTAAVSLASSLIFLDRSQAIGFGAFLEAYLLLAPLLWAAIRFETRGAALAVFLMATIAVVGTALGRGPVQDDVLNERLWMLQAFIGLVAATFLVLGALAAATADARRELLAAMEAAEGSSHAKSRFLAVMSHELRTPLNGILGYVALLESRLQETTPADVRHLGRIRAAALHLTSVIEGILTFSRSEAGREELDIQSFDAAELVRESVALLEPEAARKELSIRAVVQPSIPLRSDPGKLRQVLLNLLSNAVKFSDRGEIVVEAAEDGGVIVFRVRDQGPGIPAERLEAIFVPFNRVSVPVDTTLGGTGLGLSVCMTLARLMHGKLTVESRMGVGSVFTLEIPKDVIGSDQTAAPQRS